MIESLPHELLTHVFAFVPGVDLLRIPTVSRSLHRELGHNDSVWKRRLLASSKEPTTTWKQQYTATTSMQFSGDLRGGAIPLPSKCTIKWDRSAFSIDLWMCLLQPSAESNFHVGGVLLGAQSTSWMEADKATPDAQQQLIQVDKDGNLYCSVTTKRRENAVKKLQTNRWYHIALAYNHCIQSIYIDGELVRTEQDSLHHEWGMMKEFQFGTGFLSLGSKTCPTEEFCGWYGFSGLLQAPHVWDRALSISDVQTLAMGDALSHDGGPTWPAADTQPTVLGSVTNVHCSRPLERYNTRI